MNDEKRTFVVTGGISLHVNVEAESIEEAFVKANDADIDGLVTMKSARGKLMDTWMTSGELDCDPSEAKSCGTYLRSGASYERRSP